MEEPRSRGDPRKVDYRNFIRSKNFNTRPPSRLATPIQESVNVSTHPRVPCQLSAKLKPSPQIPVPALASIGSPRGQQGVSLDAFPIAQLDSQGDLDQIRANADATVEKLAEVISELG